MATPQQGPTTFKTLNPVSDLTVSSSTATKTVSSPLVGRQGLYVANNDASIHMRWGNSGVTTTKGGRIAAGTAVWIAAGPDCDVYLIAESGSPTASITEAG